VKEETRLSSSGFYLHEKSLFLRVVEPSTLVGFFGTLNRNGTQI